MKRTGTPPRKRQSWPKLAASHRAVRNVIASLGLTPLDPEGGYFAETYRSAERYGDRALSTAIYYLLDKTTFSAMHRIKSDEVFHFYLGDPVEMLLLRPDGTGEVVVIGTDLKIGERPQVVVPGGTWQGARIRAKGRRGFALMGTTVAPGFDPADFEIGNREALCAEFPDFAGLISGLTRSG